jgi:tetratricopeptide (TPR) repeat protein
MLETIREFAMEKAVERGVWAELRARHAELFVEMTEEFGRNVLARDTRAWLDRFAQDHDNVRAAISWATETGATELALRIGAASWRFWQMRGHLVEGLDRVERALALPDRADHPRVAADALDAAAGLAYWLADSERSRAWYIAEIDLRRELDDRPGLANALYGIAFTWAILELQNEASAREATSYINDALATYRELGDEAGIARCEWALGNILWGSGMTVDAREHAEHAHELFLKVGDRFMTGWASYTLGLAASSARRRTCPATRSCSMRWPSPPVGPAIASELHACSALSRRSSDAAGLASTRGTAACSTSTPTSCARTRRSPTPFARGRP